MATRDDRPAPASGPIRVLVVEDSPVSRALLTSIIAEAPGFEVVGTARDGEAAVELVRRLRPSVVTMDIHMPRLDGVEATRRIMAETPTPIVVVTASAQVDGPAAYEAIAAGALSIVARPVGPQAAEFEERRRSLLDEIRLMAGISVVRRIHRRDLRSDPGSARPPAGPATGPDGGTTGSRSRSASVPGRAGSTAARAAPATPVRVVGIAASTGGPAALARILADLPPGFPVPIVIVQHISRGFLAGLAEWLGAVGRLPVRLAGDAELLPPSGVRLAPEDRHLRVTPGGFLRLSATEPVDGHRPSATVLFDSLARTYGPAAIGVVLTGMGRDGAVGLASLRRLGGWVVAQDEESSAVFGMPGAAIAVGAVDEILPLSEIGAALVHRVAAGATATEQEPGTAPGIGAPPGRATERPREARR